MLLHPPTIRFLAHIATAFFILLSLGQGTGIGATGPGESGWGYNYIYSGLFAGSVGPFMECLFSLFFFS